nr:hypothetical protein [Tanacetum cinerariifolium]
MLIMRAKIFLNKTGRKLTVNENETIGFDKSNVECYNCHKRGHFARKYRVLRNQYNKHKESSRRSVHVETSASTALVSCDGLGGYDWIDQAEEGPNYALIAFSSSSSNLEVSNDSTCSKSCLETVELLKSLNDQLLKDLKKSELMVLGYMIGLKSMEERLEFYKTNESVYLEDIKVLKVEIQIREIAIRELRKKLEIAQKEKDGIQLNFAFRVFNSRTRIVEENLHIRFSESTLNVVGSGPDWLFDIDALTRTINYEPTVASTQSNDFADFMVYQMDVKSDFLYGKIKEEVYVCQPLGFEDPYFLDRVYKVEKHCMDCIKLLEHGDILLVQVYVDDSIFGSTKKELCNAFERLMHEKFQMSSMRELTFFLGLQFWSTTMAKTINGEVQIHARVDGKEIVITESSIRRDLQLADEEGKGFSGRVTPLFQTMVEQNQSQLGEGLAILTYPHHTPTILQPSSSQPQKTQKPKKHKIKDTRATTTASSLEAEQDNGNINKTQSKEIPNESSSQGTNSSGGPRCQETIGDTTAQTRFESVSKHYNDLLLARDKSTQRNEIDSLKRMVKKLEKRNRLRTHKLKRLYKVGLTARVEFSRDKESLSEDASKQGRTIDAIDVDDEITLVNDDDNEMFDVDDLGGEEVKGIVFQESGKSTTTTIISSQHSQDKGKGIMIEEPVKPKKKDQIRLDKEATLKLQAKFDEEERLARKS